MNTLDQIRELIKRLSAKEKKALILELRTPIDKISNQINELQPEVSAL